MKDKKLKGSATLSCHAFVSAFRPNTGTSTSNINTWGWPERLEVNEYADQIEMVYKETNNMVYTVWPSPPPEVRVFKIVYSVVDGKWNKSERIYGKIIPKSKESYEFED